MPAGQKQQLRRCIRPVQLGLLPQAGHTSLSPSPSSCSSRRPKCRPAPAAMPGPGALTAPTTAQPARSSSSSTCRSSCTCSNSSSRSCRQQPARRPTGASPALLLPQHQHLPTAAACRRLASARRALSAPCSLGEACGPHKGWWTGASRSRTQQPRGSRRAPHLPAPASPPSWEAPPPKGGTWGASKRCRAHGLPPAALCAHTPAGPRHLLPWQQQGQAAKAVA